MIKYWDYIIRPLAKKNDLKSIAIYNYSRELFWKVFEYCRENDGVLYLINNYDFLDESFLNVYHENIVLVSERNGLLECQIVLAEQETAYRNIKDDLSELKFANCKMFASNMENMEFVKTCVVPNEEFCWIKGIPYGGLRFFVAISIKDQLNTSLNEEAFWNGVEMERRKLEEELRTRTLNSFTQRSRVYNAEEILRKDEIDKVKKQYNVKIEEIKNSKRYRLGSKIANLGQMVSFGDSDKKKAKEEAIPKGKKLDQLVRDLKISDPEEVYKTYINYSPILKSMALPLSKCEKVVLEKMEQKKAFDTERYMDYGQEELVSVIMPTFNRGAIISHAIASVLRQTYKNFELLIVDDFSTDNTKDEIKKFVDDSRVKYLKNSHIKGVCGARNTGLENARGVYIAYLDTDNEWDEDYLLLSINKLKEQTEYRSIFSAQRIWKLNNAELKINSYRFGVYAPSMLENRNYVDINSFVHTRDMYIRYGGFDEELERMTDWELILRYGRHHIPYSYPVFLCDYFEEGKQNDRISDVVDENYSLFASKFNYNKLKLSEAEHVIENGYEMYSNADGRVYKKYNHLPTIIIPNYEALGCLKLCIASIRRYTRAFDYEIIIVDNCSSEEVQDYLRKISEDIDIQVIQNEYNMGFTYAVNQGIKAARQGSDYILLNNDAIVTENWLEELYEAKEKVPEAGLIVPRQVLITQTKTMGIHVPGCNRNREQDVNLSYHHKNIVDIISYARYGYVELSFAAFFMVMITKECYQRLGLLDEVNGRHYKSDRLYCAKAAEYGIKMIYTPFSKAYHLLQQSTVQLKRRDQKMYDIIFKKNNWDDLNGKIDPSARAQEMK